MLCQILISPLIECDIIKFVLKVCHCYLNFSVPKTNLTTTTTTITTTEIGVDTFRFGRVVRSWKYPSPDPIRVLTRTSEKPPNSLRRRVKRFTDEFPRRSRKFDEVGRTLSPQALEIERKRRDVKWEVTKEKRDDQQSSIYSHNWMIKGISVRSSKSINI